MTLRLDDIDCFLSVAQFGRVRKAAIEMGITQPAATKAIQRLEQELGFPLFVRSRQGMELTPVARHFHDRLLSLRRGLGAAIRESADMHLGEIGVVRIGVSPLYVRPLFLEASIQLHRERPAANINLRINLNDALLKALRNGDIDLSLNALPQEMPDDLSATPLFPDDLCLVVRERHPLLTLSQLRLADLANAHWMLPGMAVAARRTIEGRFAEAALPGPRVVIEYDNSTGHVSEFVRSSDLVSLMNERTLKSRSGAGLCALPGKWARIRRNIGVMQLKEAHLPPLAIRMQEILLEQAR